MYQQQSSLLCNMDVVDILRRMRERSSETKILSRMEVPSSLWSGISITKGKMTVIAS